MITIPFDKPISKNISPYSHHCQVLEIRQYLHQHVAPENMRLMRRGCMSSSPGERRWTIREDTINSVTVIVVIPEELETYITLRFLHTG